MIFTIAQEREKKKKSRSGAPPHSPVSKVEGPWLHLIDQWHWLRRFAFPWTYVSRFALKDFDWIRRMTTMSMMAIIRRWCSFGVSVVLVFSLLITTSIGVAGVFGYNGVLNVKYKYAGRERSLTQLKAHDSRRQLRILAGVDLPLGGSGRPDAVGFAFHSFFSFLAC